MAHKRTQYGKQPSNARGDDMPKNGADKSSLSVYKVLIGNLLTESHSGRQWNKIDALIIHLSDHLFYNPLRNEPIYSKRDARVTEGNKGTIQQGLWC